MALYLQEAGRHESVRAVAGEADFVGCSLIAYPEVRSALARALREAPPRLTETGYKEVPRDFEADWPVYSHVLPGEDIIRLAGDLAEKYALRGSDAIHLASAITFERHAPRQVSFSAWDRSLNRAAAAEGFGLAHPEVL